MATVTREQIIAAWQRFAAKIASIRKRQCAVLEAYDKRLSAEKIERIHKKLK